MNRRKFLKTTGALSVALIGLPIGRKIFAQDVVESSKKDPIDEYRKNVDKDADDFTIYVLKIDNGTVLDFSKASTEDKRITFEIEKRDPDKVYNTLGKLKYEFYISSVQEGKEYNHWQVKAERAKKISGDMSWPSNLPTNLSFEITIRKNVNIFDKSGNSVAKLFYSDEFEDCFITTACVQERGLADNCYELDTLRFLRENYMRQTEQGGVLLDEYEWLGPAVVSAIDKCANKSEIYDYLYTNMILPSVAMIEQKQYQEAVDWYEGFTLQLKKNFLTQPIH